MRNLFAFRGYIIRRDGNVVTVAGRAGIPLSTHGIGATTITGTEGPLATAERREVREIIGALERAVRE